ncbi:MAG: energy-coupling factor transporter transmembrane protein EcfT [Spirochaetales bacterium]|nr:energy-coupling factor transporter transmembrane protein EcfT [Spirochaetales bacterium]
MLRDVTLGRYYPTSSFLHGLDPRTKLAGAVLYAVSVFIASSPISFAVSFAALCLLMLLSRVPLRYMLRGLAPVWAVMCMVCLLNIFIHSGSAWRVLLIAGRMVELVFISNLVTLTTKPKSLSDGMEKALRWLGLFKVPVHDLATALSIALRFIPILADEARHVMDAQKARGADLGKGSILNRARALAPVLVPMFVSAFRRADTLSIAMESRLYGSGKVGHLRPLAYGREDAAAYICILTYFAVMILLKGAGL